MKLLPCPVCKSRVEGPKGVNKNTIQCTRCWYNLIYSIMKSNDQMIREWNQAFITLSFMLKHTSEDCGFDYYLEFAKSLNKNWMKHYSDILFDEMLEIWISGDITNYDNPA